MENNKVVPIGVPFKQRRRFRIALEIEIETSDELDAAAALSTSVLYSVIGKNRQQYIDRFKRFEFEEIRESRGEK